MVDDDGSVPSPSSSAPSRGRVPRAALILLGVLLMAVVVLSAFLLARDGEEPQAPPTAATPTESAPSDTSSSEATSSEAAPSEGLGATVEEIASFSGSGPDTTDSFEAAENWELRWEAQNPVGFGVELLTADETSRGQVVQGGEDASGATFVSEEGEFRLRVTADGDWSVTVTGVPAGG